MVTSASTEAPQDLGSGHCQKPGATLFSGSLGVSFFSGYQYLQMREWVCMD